MLATPKVIVLLLNWRNSKDTVDCLESIVKSRDSEIAGVVLCDNGSRDGSIELFEKWFKEKKLGYTHLIFNAKSNFESIESNSLEKNGLPFYLIDNQQNLGFAAGNNTGIEFIRTNLDFDYIYLLNNDTEIVTNTVSAMVQKFKETPDVGLCGSKIIYSSLPNTVQTLGGAEFNRVFGRAVNIGAMSDVSVPIDEVQVSNRLDYIHGASMMISKSCLSLIGTMEESYFLYFEEIDWAERAKAEGFKLVFANNSIVYHKEGASIGSSYDKNMRSSLSTYYMTSSRLRFMMKFYPYFLPTVYLLHLYQMTRFLLKGNGLHFYAMLKANLFIPFNKN